MLDMLDPMVQQWIVFFVMVGLFTGCAWFITPSLPKHPTIHVTEPPKDLKGLKVRFILASDYRHYRNPMRTLRRFCGWPSGRQWVKLRKHWNRERPNGARLFANVVARLTSPVGAKS